MEKTNQKGGHKGKKLKIKVNKLPIQKKSVENSKFNSA
jgi:hypothetical protein